ncbi:MAG: hypothetical protein EYC70_08570 [Planctomycetota bacterium]|nr:MAG: hypothetical protein EYC70_08570 [Planctomycetota bacterium]
MGPLKDRDQPSDPAEQRQRALVQEWEATLGVFRTFQTVAVHQRFQHLGLLFEHLAPWIERGIQGIALRYFILLPKELALARLFAKAARKEELPRTYEAFLLWVEGSILHDVTHPTDEIGATNCALGEPSPALQQRFNRLPFPERALLYLFMVERNSLAAVAERAGLSSQACAAALNRIWRKIAGEDASIRLPLGWRAPQNPLTGESASGEE